VNFMHLIRLTDWLEQLAKSGPRRSWRPVWRRRMMFSSRFTASFRITLRSFLHYASSASTALASTAS